MIPLPRPSGHEAASKLSKIIFIRSALLLSSVTLLLCITVAVMAIYEQRVAVRRMNDTISRLVADTCTHSLHQGSSLDPVLRNVMNEFLDISFVIVSRDGAPMNWISRQPGADLQPIFEQIGRATAVGAEDAASDAGGDRLSRVLGDTGVLLTIGFKRSSLDDTTRRRLTWFFVISGVCLILGLLLASSISVRSTRDLLRAEQALRESESRYQVVVEQAQDSIMLLERVAGGPPLIHYANKGTERQTGYGVQELIGQPTSLLLPDETEQDLRGRFDQLRQGKTINHEAVARRKDGSRYDVEVCSQMVVYEGKEYIQSVARDISERLALQEQLQVSQRLEAVGRLAGGIAHDINNTLGAALSSATQLRRQLHRSGEDSKLLDRVVLAIKLASSSMTNVLQFARPSRRQRYALDLNDVADDVLTLLSNSLLTKKIAVRKHLSEVPCPIEGERGQVHQALMNLCLNAADAMAPGDLMKVSTGREEVEELRRRNGAALRAGRWVYLEVEDSGTGMDEHVVSRVFEPFYTTKSGTGTGLGLTVVRSTVESLEGQIEIHSEVGVGTTVRLWFPETDAAPSRFQAQRSEPGVTARFKGCVLLVDDERLIRWATREALEEMGLEVIEAASGEEALSVYSAHLSKIDLVLLDLVMPGVDGIETMERMNAMNPDVRVLLTSGFAKGHSAESLAAHKSAGYIEKPFTFEALNAEVRRVLAAE